MGLGGAGVEDGAGGEEDVEDVRVGGGGAVVPGYEGCGAGEGGDVYWGWGLVFVWIEEKCRRGIGYGF